MYSFGLFVHSWGRWLVLICMVILLVKSYRGWLTGEERDKKFDSTRLITMIVFDLQVTLGIYLYCISPLVKTALKSGADMMSDAQLRFVAVEHMTAMIVALIIFHVGNVMVKKASDSKVAFKRMAITITIVFLIVIASIPWPFLPYGRVLFRGL